MAPVLVLEVGLVAGAGGDVDDAVLVTVSGATVEVVLDEVEVDEVASEEISVFSCVFIINALTPCGNGWWRRSVI